MRAVTADDVAAYLGLPATADREWLTRAADAATAYVNGLSHVTPADVDPAPEWADDTAAGAVMLAGRFYQSRNAPLGAAGFDAAGGLVLARTDPELARLLRIGRYLRPAAY